MTALEKTSAGEYRLITPFSGLAIGVIGKTANPVDYSADSAAIRAAEKELLGKATGLEARNIVALNQLHGDSIIMIHDKPEEDSLIFGEADGLMTAVGGICLVIRTADCVPVFAYDRKRRVLGAVHSGWRGTRLAIAGKMARLMKERYGSSPEDVHAWILPSIGPGSYTVGRDVADLFPRDITEQNGLIYLDLWQNIERSLVDEGIPRDNIFNAGMCTLKMKDEFFSYRAGDGGRNLNFGFLS
ncbi:MAG TPA: peptidoglycan editing factor PgeF [Spirochaetota bacterium]|nr:peptidoglycan editing factor PgeF [Spirochaetota bacterium]HPV43530.1 peptidoglycan editing factor PgeF [Spirochaetota bacterium]